MSEKKLSERIEDYWNGRSENLGAVRNRELHGKNFGAWSRFFENHLPRKKLKILDVGTGAGFFPVILSKLGYEVFGIDMSSEMLNEARKNFSEFECRVEVQKMDAQNLEFDDESFDVVISRNLTWTLPNVEQAYREWFRVLKSNGLMMNFDSNYGTMKFSTEGNHLQKKIIDECNEIKDQLEISRLNRPDWDRKFLIDLGFSVEIEADISKQVQIDSSIQYDDIPVFAIIAQK